MATANDKLKQIVTDLKVAQQSASIDPFTWADPRTRPAAHLRKMQAEDEVKSLTSAYKTLVVNHFFRVFVSGDRAQEFGEYAAKEGAVVVDGTHLYTHLAKALWESQDPNQRKFGPHQQFRLVTELGYYGQSQQYMSMMTPKFDPADMDAPTPTMNDLVQKIRRSIRNANGDDLNRLHLEKSIVSQALDVGAATTVIPVVITGLTTEETQEMFKSLFGGSPAMDLIAGPESTNESLLKAINSKIRSVFKANNKQ